MPGIPFLNIICLNTWAGMVGMDRFLPFFAKYQGADVFCLQEVWHADGHELPTAAAGKDITAAEPKLLERLRTALPGHVGIYTPQCSPYGYFGLALFYRKGLSLLAFEERCVYREPGYVSPVDIADHARVMHIATLGTGQGPVAILNVHGAWQPGGKGDTPERLEQSRRIVAAGAGSPHPSILCGDFNLLPETQSIRSLEEAGWENLVRTHGIASTRTPLYGKAERFADYVFVKNGVRVRRFEVLPDVVSDHAALSLECSFGG